MLDTSQGYFCYLKDMLPLYCTLLTRASLSCQKSRYWYSQKRRKRKREIREEIAERGRVLAQLFPFFSPSACLNFVLFVYFQTVSTLLKEEILYFFSPLVLHLGFTIITFKSFNLLSRAVPSISVHVSLPFNQPDGGLAFINNRAIFRLRSYNAVVEFCNISWKRKIFSSDTLDSHLYHCPDFLFHFSALIQCRAPLCVAYAVCSHSLISPQP